MQPYPATSFVNSRSTFHRLVERLLGDEAANLDHAALERLIDTEGREVLRSLYQDHLDLRGLRDEASSVPMAGTDGHLRTEKRRGERELGTLFGSVTVRRLALVKRGVSGGLRPFDARLNLPVGKHSFGVQRQIAWGAAQSSFEATVENVRRTTGATIGKRQAEELAIRLTADFDSFYRDTLPVASEQGGDLLVLTFDGSGVVMRPESLRPATRKKAGSPRRRSLAEQSATHGPRRERANRKRMAEVAAVYSVKPNPRGPADVLGDLHREGPSANRPRPTHKRVWASVQRSVFDVVEDAFLEAGLRDPETHRRWVVVVDGNQDQLRAIDCVSHNFGVEPTVVVDLIHVLGYLWKAAKALHPNNLDQVHAWVSQRTRLILQGESSAVAAGMRRSATHRNLSLNDRKAIDACARYFLKYRKYLRYHEYLADGLPIASGVIEGACRSLVKDRMDITGARWGLAGAEAVLKLRSLRASGDLDEYLEFHAEEELRRNHLEQFDGRELVELRAAA